MSTLDIVIVCACWCTPLVLFALKAWQDYERRNWSREDAEALAEFLKGMRR
jgi:hypothetical protein